MIDDAFILIDECVELYSSVSIFDLTHSTSWLAGIFKAAKNLSSTIDEFYAVYSCVISRTINHKQIIISIRLIVVSRFHFTQL